MTSRLKVTSWSKNVSWRSGCLQTQGRVEQGKRSFLLVFEIFFLEEASHLLTSHWFTVNHTATFQHRWWYAPPRKTWRENGCWLANSSFAIVSKPQVFQNLGGGHWARPHCEKLEANWELSHCEQTGGCSLQPGPKNTSQGSPVRIEGAAYTHSQEPTLVWSVRYEGMFVSLLVSSILLSLPRLCFLSGFCSLVASTLFHLFLIWRIITVVM